MKGLFSSFSLFHLFLVLGAAVLRTWAKVVPLIQPGFFFDYNIEGQSPPIPITEQCETIHIKWSRQGAIGANPVAPYSMVVYTSTFTVPFTIAMGSGLSFDWQVPFAPGTQYQICMWDANGLPGGCQAMYTVVKNSTVDTPTCQNVTMPTQLQVNATQAVPEGPLSQYGFINQCTDIFVLPRSGKPPYTLTVAPPLHPPYNITSDTMDAIDWTVSLSWSYPFFLSLQSADGQLWSYGPLHAGGFGPDDCLAPGNISQSKAHSMAVGAGLGSAFGAAIIGALGAFLYLRYRQKPKPTDVFENLHQRSPPPDPFDTRSRTRSGSQGTSQLGTEPVSWTTFSDAPSSSAPRSRAYVLHHDAGQAPVTVITEAEEVVELPPRYRTEGGSSVEIEQVRRPAPVHREKRPGIANTMASHLP